MLEIITDSASDIPAALREKYHLHVIPTPVVIDGVDYLDGETLSPDEFYQIQREGKQQISTYHINPDMFEQAFLPYAREGKQVIYICFSTGIAATFNAAHVALETIREQYPEFDLTIVDSRCASAGFGLMVLNLLRLKEKGAGKEVILEAVDFYRNHIRHVFTVETLEYLVKGGRVSRPKGALAGTLDIRPILTVDENGSLKIMKLVRGRKRSLKALAEYVKEQGRDLELQTVAFCHGEMMEAVTEVMGLIGVALSDPVISQVGCAIGAHTGSQILGVCFLDAPDPYR